MVSPEWILSSDIYNGQIFILIGTFLDGFWLRWPQHEGAD